MIGLSEEFAGGGTLLHRMDPRVKVVVAAFFSITVAVSVERFPLFLALGFAFALAVIARLNFFQVLRRLVPANAFVLVLWLTLPATVVGEPAAWIGPIVLSREGIRLAFLVTLKANAIVISIIALLNTSRLLDIAHAARHLRVPDKLVMIFYFCIRYFHLIGSEYLRLREAMKVRSFRPRTNMRTYKSYANLLGMLLVRSHDRAERVYAAMLCRGFNGRINILSHFRLRPIDYVSGIGMMIFVVILVYFQWHPAGF